MGVRGKQLKGSSSSVANGRQASGTSITKSIPANTLVEDEDRLIIEAFGNSAASSTISVTFNAVTIFSHTLGGSPRDWYLRMQLVKTGANFGKTETVFVANNDGTENDVQEDSLGSIPNLWSTARNLVVDADTGGVARSLTVDKRGVK